MKQLMKKAVMVMLVMSLVFGLSQSGAKTSQAAAKMPNKLYKLVKGQWYSQASSSGYNVKFTKTRVNYYDRETDKLVYSGKIKKVKKIKSGQRKGCYRIIYKNAHGISSFESTDKSATIFESYDSASGYSSYSGSSSIEIGKW